MVVSLGTLLVMGCMAFVKQHLLDRELLDLLQASHQSYDDLKSLQTQLVQSEKLASLGHLVGGAAHELNNPLTAMLGYSDLLSATPMDEAPRGLADNIGHQVRRTKTLVSSLLNFAQQKRVEKIRLDLNVLAQTAVNLSQQQLRARKIEVRTNLSHDLPPVLGDSNQLLQVCMHIANNAVLAMADGGGTLTINSRRRDNFAVLEFCDNGSGTKKLADVQDRCETAQPEDGLGLSTCRGIIQEHHGRLLCQDHNEGGATFQIELPAADGRAARAVQDNASSVLELTTSSTVR